MSEITLEKVDQVIERTYATYAEAKEALEACDGDTPAAFIKALISPYFSTS